MNAILNTDVAIIGAGPSGAIAAALLIKQGLQVTVLERQHFPRFSIGESLLPHCMSFIAEANMLDAVNAMDFQFKNGAAFTRDNQYNDFNFSEKFSAGPGTTYQVERAKFDKVLADEAAKQGADIRYGHSVNNVEFDNHGARLSVTTDQNDAYTLESKFLLDASGFGRVLPRLLDLEAPSNFPARMSVFTHIQDNINSAQHDRDKILIIVHPQYKDVWFWLIPFTGGRCSLGVVAEPHRFQGREDNLEQLLKDFVNQTNDLGPLLANAVFDTQVQTLQGYSSNVKTLWGSHYALLGNAGEFLDPVFSSGVTIAMKSASLAAPLVAKQLAGADVDWQKEYAQPLQQGVNTFRSYVEAWYDGRFQDIIFSKQQNPDIGKMISSILAGYAWDEQNPFVKESQRRINTLAELCRA